MTCSLWSHTDTHERRWLIGLVIALTVWTLSDVRRRGRVDVAHPERHMTDLTVYTGAGAAFFTSEEPYEFETIRGWKYAYPPLFALVMAPLSLLPTTEQAVVWCLLCMLMAFGSWYEAVRISKAFGYDVRLAKANHTQGRLIGWLAVVAIALPTMNCLQRGQVGVTKLYLLMLGLRIMVEATRGRWVMIGAAVFALPTAIKITPIVALAVVGWQNLVGWFGRRDHVAASKVWGVAAGGAIGLVLCLLVIPAALLGWEANLRHLKTWHRVMGSMASDVDPEGQIGTPYTVRNQSLTNAVYRLANWGDFMFAGGPDDRLVDASPAAIPWPMAMDAAWIPPFLTSVKVLTLALLMGLATVVALRQDRLGQAATVGLALAATMIISPISRGHYYPLLLPALLWVPLLLSRRRSTAWVMVMAATPTVLILAHYLGLAFTGRIGLLGIGITGWYLVAATDVLLVVMNNTLLMTARPDVEDEEEDQETVHMVSTAPARRAA